MSDDNAEKDRDLLVSLSPGEARWALRDAGRVIELGVARDTDGPRPGEIYLGRVGSVVPAANAAFVDLGNGQDGFLSGRDARQKIDADGASAAPPPDGDPVPTDIAKLVTEGEALLVQVKRAALDDKAAQLTTALTLAGWHLVLTPDRPGVRLSRRIAEPADRARLTALSDDLAAGLPDGAGLILRTAAATADAEALGREAQNLAARWKRILQTAEQAEAPKALDVAETPVAAVLRASANTPPGHILLDRRAGLAAARNWLAAIEPGLAARADVFANDVGPPFDARTMDDAFDSALAGDVALPGGGSLVIEPTAALVAIDVNTGGRSGSQGRAILETNLAAARETARQIRLRNLAGLIVIDFVRMRAREDRTQVLAVLREALAGAAPDAEAAGFTRFGLVEIVRPREGAALHEALGESVLGGGWRHSAETVALAALRDAMAAASAYPGKALRLSAGSAVIAALEGPLRNAHGAAEAALGLTIALTVDTGRVQDRGQDGFDISPA